MSNYELVILSERVCKRKHHVSYDTVIGMENAFVCAGGHLEKLSPTIYFINRLINKTLSKKILYRLPDVTIKTEAGWYLYISMGLGDLRKQVSTLRGLSLKTKKVIIYCFDVWETQYEQYNRLFSYIKPAHIFLAYKYSADYFNRIFLNTHFMPQAADGQYFYPRDVKKERIFMQMGRKTDSIHKMILHYLKKRGIEDNDNNYLYERISGKILYLDTNELAENICRTWFFVCAPQAIDNRKLTGNVSDVTARFYEAMLCKSLIIGFKPETYDQLFPSDSMVELNADGSDFDEKIDYYLKHEVEYYKLVERNYTYVIGKCMWRNRYENMISVINNNRIE